MKLKVMVVAGLGLLLPAVAFAADVVANGCCGGCPF
jgi:hypothetical protein